MNNGALRESRKIIEKVLKKEKKEEKKRLEQEKILKEEIDVEFKSVCNDYIPKVNDYLPENHHDVAVLYDNIGHNILLVDDCCKCKGYEEFLNSVGFDTRIEIIYADGIRHDSPPVEIRRDRN